MSRPTIFEYLPARSKMYKFSQPPESYIETCTSFYVFSGLRWLTGWVGYWTPTQSHHHSSASHRPTPPPRHHYLWHTIGNNSMSWFGAICLLWRAPVPFLHDAKLIILSCQCMVVIDARINQSKRIVTIQKVIWSCPRPTGPTYALGPYMLEKEKEWDGFLIIQKLWLKRLYVCQMCANT